MVLVGRRLLPNRDPIWGNGRIERPEELVDLYNLRERWHRLRISDGSRLNDLTLTEACLNCEFGVIVLGLERDGRIYGALQSDERLRVGDVLLLQGHDHDVAAAAAAWGAELPARRAAGLGLVGSGRRRGDPRASLGPGRQDRGRDAVPPALQRRSTGHLARRSGFPQPPGRHSLADRRRASVAGDRAPARPIAPRSGSPDLDR